MQNALWEKRAAKTRAWGWALFGLVALAIAGYCAASLTAAAGDLALTCREYALDAELVDCRWPAIWQVVGVVALVSGLVAFVLAWRQRAGEP